jgi:hypothetical protein
MRKQQVLKNWLIKYKSLLVKNLKDYIKYSFIKIVEKAQPLTPYISYGWVCVHLQNYWIPQS